jgi:predicted Rossmann-fold nucleotide-binding protein
MTTTLPAPPTTVDTEVSPRGTLEVLSQREVEQLRLVSDTTRDSPLFQLFQRCALAVLNCGSEEDDAAAIFDRYGDFSIEIVQRTRGLKLKIRNAPAGAFIDGRIIEGIRQHLFAVLRDLVYIGSEIEHSARFDLTKSDNITDAVFHVLKNAAVLDPNLRPNLVVCWGGHAVSREEYDYSKGVGYHLGLRRLDVCTGCGPGAMKGPMKGAALGHAKQRLAEGRYVGLTEPGIIAAEPPNPIVNRLVVLPDVEKRLEAFIRMAHGIIVFPGGVGTAEEILYLMGVLTDPANEDQYLPVIFTGPEDSRDYFAGIDRFLAGTLGEQVRSRYKIVIDDAEQVARYLAKRIRKVESRRRRDGDAFYFNWLLRTAYPFQQPFEVTHDSVKALELHRALPTHELAANLRRAFSAIVTGNVKEPGIRLIRSHGPFEIRGDRAVMDLMDRLLEGFVEQGRMKLAGARYEPCYRVVGAA